MSWVAYILAVHAKKAFSGESLALQLLLRYKHVAMHWYYPSSKWRRELGKCAASYKRRQLQTSCCCCLTLSTGQKVATATTYVAKNSASVQNRMAAAWRPYQHKLQPLLISIHGHISATSLVQVYYSGGHIYATPRLSIEWSFAQSVQLCKHVVSAQLRKWPLASVALVAKKKECLKTIN